MAAIEKPILRSATTVIALTDAEVDSYREFCPSVPCRVISNGIDVDLYRTEPVDPAFMNIPPSAPVILFLGRLHPHKGADKLVEAFIRASSQIPEAVLVMAGPDEFSLGDKLRDMVRHSGLQDRVIFPGMVTGEQKKDLLARSTLFCLPSVGEGFSMAVLEALASGTPVMISPGCYFPEVVSAGAGRVVSIEPEAMAQHMIELIRNRDVLQEMGSNGRRFVAQNYTWEAIADKHEEAYREGITRFSRKD